MYSYKKDIEVIDSVDVIVAGAGPAGISAAVAAALSIKRNVSPRNLHASDVRNTLINKGIEL